MKQLEALYSTGVCMLVVWSCPPSNPMDCSPPACSVHLILQAGILECIAIPSEDLSDPGSNPALQADPLTGRRLQEVLYSLVSVDYITALEDSVIFSKAEHLPIL